MRTGLKNNTGFRNIQADFGKSKEAFFGFKFQQENHYQRP
jgi:hypothetical protein